MKEEEKHEDEKEDGVRKLWTKRWWKIRINEEKE
jgi:hypothetical protein